MGSIAYTVSGATETGETRYKAFGATRFTSGTTPTSFRYTGQREEVNFGLYYYGARWYDPALGHFVQADTIVPDASYAGDYHRYAYTRFNPLKYTDPSGHATGPAVHDSNGGPPTLLSYEHFFALQVDYHAQGVAYSGLPSDVQQAFDLYKQSSHSDEVGYVDMGPGATSQAGTIRDPAVIGSSLFGGWRLGKFALQLLGLACGDGNCTNEAAAAKGSLQIIGDAAKYSASELNAAQHMAKLGNSVILRPPSNVARTSDLLVNGMPYDVYTPITSNANRIISAIAHKSSQAQGIVLDLSRTSVTAQDLGNILARVQGTGAKNIVDIVIIGGK